MSRLGGGWWIKAPEERLVLPCCPRSQTGAGPGALRAAWRPGLPRAWQGLPHL